MSYGGLDVWQIRSIVLPQSRYEWEPRNRFSYASSMSSPTTYTSRHMGTAPIIDMALKEYLDGMALSSVVREPAVKGESVGCWASGKIFVRRSCSYSNRQHQDVEY